MVFGLLSGSSSHGSSEYILVLLLGEVDVIVSVRVRVLSGVIPVILPGVLSSKVVRSTVAPVLNGKVANGSSLVVIRYLHCSLVGLVIDSLSSQVPLSLLSKSLKNMVGADLHDGDLLVEASLFVLLGGTSLILSYFSETSSRDFLALKGEVLRVLHVRRLGSTTLVSEGLTLSIGMPVVVSLNVSVIFIEGVIEVTVNPSLLRDESEVEGGLSVLSGLSLVSLSNGIKLFIEI